MARILITGASRGIGRAIATALADKKNNLILHGRDRSALKKVSLIVGEAGGASDIVVADLSSREGINDLIEAVTPTPIDILINNAGIAAVGDVQELELEDWDRTLSINVTAPFMLTKACLPKMKRGASIVNILSTASQQGFSGWSSYCMSKSALNGFALALREEVRSRGIRVINIYPAATATEIWNNIPGEWTLDSMMSPNEIAQAVVYALSAPPGTVAENITLGNIGGAQ
ncbi:MAG: SDR family NAD(P)-dependent oxidoreductase [bacterium]|nr:SDR family NAD(P)-dependent oxidoreductase [bacterium]